MLERAEYPKLPGADHSDVKVKMPRCGQSAGKSWLTPQRLHARPLAQLANATQQAPSTVRLSAFASRAVYAETMPTMPALVRTASQAVIVITSPVTVGTRFLCQHDRGTVQLKMTASTGWNEPIDGCTWRQSLALIGAPITVEVVYDLSWAVAVMTAPAGLAEDNGHRHTIVLQLSLQFAFQLVFWVVLLRGVTRSRALPQALCVAFVVFAVVRLLVERHNSP